ncbi:hypothetical protein P280DRAFT_466503 [Massarina eburnea CBS 473.64]|uniref:Uncharacterized protein n=1 Tax=Massarina eburnea CBS 473.64 TaxID=1395130 RepID=A0A6A6SBH4_9PLEO|nr:hypothetical protein P280DRAFT_466503 [Massarina eburnea CBS 473.64]
MDATQPPAWRAYVHLYLPILSIIFILCTIDNPFAHRLPLLLSGFPTYVLGSLVYPSSRPAPTPEQCIRFTRKNHLYRALVLFTYGRIMGSPFRLNYYAFDLLLSYVAGELIGERNVGNPRRSEFFVHVLWACGSGLMFTLVPPSWSMLWFLVGLIDRTVWRASWLALVDDIIGVLAYPPLGTQKGKAAVILVQSAVIAVTVLYACFSFAMAREQIVNAQGQQLDHLEDMLFGAN